MITSEKGRETFVVVDKLFVVHSRQKSSRTWTNEVSIVSVSAKPVWLPTLNQVLVVTAQTPPDALTTLHVLRVHKALPVLDMKVFKVSAREPDSDLL